MIASLKKLSLTLIFISVCMFGTNIISMTRTILLEYGHSAPSSDEQVNIEFWTEEEFLVWMEKEHKRIQDLADKHDCSYYERNENDVWVPREWTQEDVDKMYAERNEQLDKMKRDINIPVLSFLMMGHILPVYFLPIIEENYQ